jgi:hypothetical protein
MHMSDNTRITLLWGLVGAICAILLLAALQLWG